MLTTSVLNRLWILFLWLLLCSWNKELGIEQQELWQ